MQVKLWRSDTVRDGKGVEASHFNVTHAEFFNTESEAWAAWMAALLQADTMEHHEKL